MIGRVVALTGRVFDLGLRVAEDAVAVAWGLRESPRGRRMALAINVLQGRPTAYRIDVRDGDLTWVGQPPMISECTFLSATGNGYAVLDDEADESRART